MAMLAEPRQRKRYHLMPKGKALYEDESRFGTKMLEKMGWKKGEGLGASSEGSKDFVRIRYKNDAFGLGFEQRDDQWTQHEQSFNGLLKTLNNEETDETPQKAGDSVNDCEDEMPARVGFGFHDTSAKEERKSEGKKLKEKISGISLEEKSKQSKARVHYKKFTRGKDLAQYSEKDLANIFGKKAVEEHQVNDFYGNLSNTFGVIAEDVNVDQMDGNADGPDGNLDESGAKKRDKKKKKKEEHKEIEKRDEAQEEKQIVPKQTFTSNLSVQDYFKMKMEAIKNKKSGLNNNEVALADTSSPCQDEPKAMMKKKSKNKEEDSPDICIEEPAEKKSKKSKRNRDQEDSLENGTEKNAEVANKKKKKSNTEEAEETVLAETNSDTKNLADDGLRVSGGKKSKKLKIKTDQENVNENEVQHLDTEQVQEHIGKKSKKNKSIIEEKETQPVKKVKKSKVREAVDEGGESNNKAVEETKLAENGQDEDIETNVMDLKPKKKKDKNKNEGDLSNTKKRKAEETEAAAAQESTGKKRKKNKKELTEVIEINDSDQDEPTNNEIPPTVKERKQKKKSKKSKEATEETSAHEETPTVSHPAAKEPKNEVSSKAINISETADSLQETDLEDLKKQYQAFNIYPISSFCAEKFHNVSLNSFKNSSLPHLQGYGLSSDLQLDIYVSKNDEERITNLWKSALNKYEQADKPKKTYKKYIQQGINARKAKQKAPRLYVKTWQRKNAFQLV